MTNRDYFINFLRYWWNQTPMAALGFTKFSDAVAHYDSLGVSDSIGALMRPLSTDRIQSALEKLAADFGDQYPSKAAFNSALLGAGGGLDYGAIASGAAVDTLNDVKNTALFGLSLWVIMAGIGAAGLLYSMRRGKK